MTLRTACTGLIILGLLSGCGRVADSRFNPLNWFGRAQEVEVIAPSGELEIDRRPLVDSVTSLAIERTPGGAIVRATGVPPTQGYYDVALIPENLDLVPDNGVLTFTFRAEPPPDATRVSSAASREVVAGVYLSRFDLSGVREVRVVGRANALAARR